jgi:hypothetical protein
MANAAPNNNTPNPAKPPKPHARLEKWIWILIYGTEPALGWSMAVPGAVVALVGVVLIYVRSRLGDK